MPIAIKRYKDSTYIPITNPLSRRSDYTSDEIEKEKKRKKKLTRYQILDEEIKSGTYKKGLGDKLLDNLLSPY